VCWLLLLLVLRLHVCEAQGMTINGLKATYSNRDNPLQNFSVLSQKPFHDSVNPYYEDVAVCRLESRNCYHYDEMHDWGFNISVVWEGFLVNRWNSSSNDIFQLDFGLRPGTCVAAFVDEVKVIDLCMNFTTFDKEPLSDNLERISDYFTRYDSWSYYWLQRVSY
jgi:hypothetical protein